MNAKALFTMALGLGEPWKVTDIELDEAARTLVLRLDFERGARFACPDCRAQCPVHDTSEKRWRHLNFFEFKTELVARVPKTKCATHGVHVANVPWARPGSGFTLLFEAFVMMMGEQGVTMKGMSRIAGEHDTRLWRLVHHYVDQAREEADHSQVKNIGVDETSRAKGQQYVTTFVDMDGKRVLYVAEGRSSETVTEFKKDLVEHGGAQENIEEASLDMSAAFKKGLREAFPDAKLTFDKFHVIQLANERVDQTRRAEAKTTDLLKGTRFAWLKNEEDLTEIEKLQIASARLVARRTASAYRFKLRLQGIYALPRHAAHLELVKWCDAAVRSRIEPIKKLGRTVREHIDGILRWWDSGLTNGRLEGMNSLIQAAKARARGYRSFRNLQTVIYLLLGRLDFRLPGPFRTIGSRALPGRLTHAP